MFKILNQASEEEIAVITAVVDSLNKSEDKSEININYWESSSRKNTCERNTWKNKSLSNWQSGFRAY